MDSDWADPLYVRGSVACEICGFREFLLVDHLRAEHGTSVEGYLEAYPGAPIASDILRGKLENRHLPIRATEGDLWIIFGGVRFAVNPDVPPDVCLPLPKFYKVPTRGPLADDVRMASISMVAGRSTWVYGPPGTGKDAFFSAWSAMTRTPGLLLSIVPGTDIEGWLYSRAINASGTSWEDGELTRALRDGYLTEEGRRVPYIIVLSDFDRASRQQVEHLRLILDSIEGRVKGPTGQTWKVLPGTRIVATANSAGGGDTTGRFVSVQSMDATILDRFERSYEFHPLDSADELEILTARFPRVVQKHPDALSSIVKAANVVRREVASGNLYMDFSHRAVCVWAGSLDDILEYGGNFSGNPVADALRPVLDRASTDEIRVQLKRLLDPHIVNVIPITGTRKKK